MVALCPVGANAYTQLAITAAVVVVAAAAAELRPSDHGLEYQAGSPPTEPEMENFFGYGPPPPPPVALPWAAKANDTSWWRSISGRGRGGGALVGGQARHVLVAVCLVSGVLGLALLVASLATCLAACRDRNTTTTATTPIKQQTAPCCSSRDGANVKDAGNANAAANSKVVPVISDDTLV